MLRKGQLNFIKLLKIFMIFCFCVLGSRLFYVQAIQHDKYKGISEGRVNRVEYYAPRRGDIRDIRGNILAMTRDVRTVVMDPGLIALVDPVTQDRFISLLSTLLPLSKEELIEKSRFYRPISGGTWERVTDEHGSPILNSMDLPVYQQITTSEGGLPEKSVYGVCLCKENGEPMVDENGMQMFAKLNSSYQVLTNRYVRLLKGFPVEEWEKVKNALDQLEFSPKTCPGYTSKTRFNYNALKKNAIFTEKDYQREYPNGAFMSHILGYTMIKEESIGDRATIRRMRGVDGIELFLDEQLTGIVGWKEKVIRRDGSELLSKRGHYFDPVDGLTAVLTLDAVIQLIVEEELLSAMEEHSPKSASCVVLEVKTGRILAYASKPDFDPNHPGNFPEQNRSNRIIRDLIEPGSTFKVLTFAVALDAGDYTPDATVDCSSWPREWGKRPRESTAGRDFGVISLEEALMRSSNVGFGRLGWILGRDVMNEYIRKFGYRSKTGIMLPDEKTWLQDAIRPINKDRLSISRVAFGHGIAVSQLQTTMAIGAIANGGILMTPQILDHLEDANGNYIYEQDPQPIRRVVSEESAWQTVRSMQKVTERNDHVTGTAIKASMKYHTVGGKTGTAQKAYSQVNGEKNSQFGYEPGKYYASFCGFFPASDPTILISVMVDEPSQKGVYGGAVSAPIFKRIAERVASYLAIPPDKPLVNTGKNRGGDR